MKIIFKALLIILISSIIFCCKRTAIEGKVFDNFGKPLDSVNVSIVGSQFNAISDKNGDYSIGYVPGAIKMLFKKSGYSDSALSINIAIESLYPAQNIFLYKIPTNSGIYFISANDYIPIQLSKINKDEWSEGRRNVISYTTQFTYTDSYKTYTKIPKKDTLLFFDNDNNFQMLFHITTYANEGFYEILQRNYSTWGFMVGDSYDKGEIINGISYRKIIKNAFIWSVYNLDVGYYAFVGYYKKNSNPITEPLYLFEIVEGAIDTTLKSNTVNQEQAVNNNKEKFIGVWKFKDDFNNDAFLKITKDNHDGFNLQKGHKSDNIINWGNMDFSIGNGVALKFSNGKLIGTYRQPQGSAADAVYDAKITIELNSNNTLSFKCDNETFKATKTN